MLRDQKSRTSCVVVMNTTEPLARSKSSIVLFSSPARSPRGAIMRGSAVTTGA